MAKKKYGQNFLADKNILRRMGHIIASSTEGEYVLEIGPGRGQLTEYLIETAGRLTCVEIDTDLHEGLIERFGKDQDFTLIKGDFRDYEPEPEIDSMTVVGNVPYYISFEIIDFVIAYRNKIQRSYFTFQKEFAQKLTAQPCSKQYGFLTVYLAMFYDVKMHFKISASAFSPKPKVDSAFVELIRRDVPLLRDYQPQDIKSFLRSVFSMRRKKMSNILKFLFRDTDFGLTGQEISELRPEQITPVFFSKLYQSLSCLR